MSKSQKPQDTFKNLEAKTRPELDSKVETFVNQNAAKLHSVKKQKILDRGGHALKHVALVHYTPAKGGAPVVDQQPVDENSLVEIINDLENTSENFTSKGVPKLEVLSSLVGRKINAQERDDALATIAKG